MPKKFYVAFDGTIYNAVTHKFSKGHENHRGYVINELTDFNNKRISTSQHNIIEKVFDWFPGCENLEVNHINGIHNDNRRENLELVTHKENMEHAYRTGLNINYGENNPSHTTSEKQVRALCEYITNGEDHSKETYAELGAKFGVSEIVAFQILNKQTWVRVTNEYNIDPRKKYDRRSTGKGFSEKDVENICKIFVCLKGKEFLEISKIVAEELDFEYSENFERNIRKLYYKQNGYFTRITDKYDYL